MHERLSKTKLFVEQPTTTVLSAIAQQVIPYRRGHGPALLPSLCASFARRVAARSVSARAGPSS
jgi:hypothetical protein